MPIFETDDRSAILIRYKDIPILDEQNNGLNANTHNCIIIKKNATTYIFIIDSKLEVFVEYDDDRYCFRASGCQLWDESTLEIDKVKKVQGDLDLAIKPEGYKYRNIKCAVATFKLFMNIDGLDSYDVVMEELRRQEEIRKREKEDQINAQRQKEVWTAYIKQEKELLDNADKPFALTQGEANVHGGHVDIETSPQITMDAKADLLENIVDIMGGYVSGDKVVITLDEYDNWNGNNDYNIDIKIIGEITMRMDARCEGFWHAKQFKEEGNYGNRFRYGQYDDKTSTILLTYKSTEISEIKEFLEKVNDNYHFNGEISPEDVYLSFSLRVTINESDEDRKKRIEILSRRDLYSQRNMRGTYLGTLSKNGTGRRSMRIILPWDKEQKRLAEQFFKNRGNNEILIFPALFQDRVLLNRESRALEKLDNTDKLQNQSLKDFIFCSSKAQATESLIAEDGISELPEYIDCQNSQMLSLNPSQQEAVVKGLYAKDLCLLQGPPGTGKTTVISELIWQHIRKDQHVRIMLTSQTNLAIDNALNRLFSNSAIKIGSASWRNMMLIKPIRKADSDKIEEEGLPFSIEKIDKWVNENEEPNSSNNIVCRWMTHIAERIDSDEVFSDVLSEWKNALCHPDSNMRKIFVDQYKKDANVLCMTCGKVESRDFNDFENKNGFDVVIVDEASKATLPELLMPLCYARKSIIMGDHRQLPPVIFEEDFFMRIKEIDPELVERLDEKFRHDLVENSLFKRLITHPAVSSSIKSTLNLQYRMHPDINEIIKPFYAHDPGGLECGLDKDKVNSPDLSERSSRYHGLSLGEFINPKVHVVWVDVPDGEEQLGEGNSYFNSKEVDAVELVIKALSKADGFDRYMSHWANCDNSETRITESKIGVISFYSAQVKRIRRAVSSYCDRNGIKVATKAVDKFQGQESGIVVVSTVRNRGLGFTRTPERLNVALSRARRLLIIVGNSAFYSSDKAQIQGEDQIYRNVIDRIKNDHDKYVFIDYRNLRNLLNN